MIYFFRHGLDDEDYIGGWSDVDLTDEGIHQVMKTAEEMSAKGIIPSKIMSSPVKRARHTADILSKHFKIPYEVSEDFKEQNKGLLNGMEKTQALKDYPEFMDGVNIDTIYPEGESLKDLYERVKKLLITLKTYEDDTLIITHRGVINMLYYLTNDIPLDMDKKRFNVEHASLHEMNQLTLSIRRVL